jgi:hypothetical protein
MVYRVVAVYQPAITLILQTKEVDMFLMGIILDLERLSRAIKKYRQGIPRGRAELLNQFFLFLSRDSDSVRLC